MRLSEDQQIVESLNQILEDYDDYLEYDEKRPKRDRNFDGLQIKIKSSAERNVQVIEDIRQELEKATNRKYFFTYGGSYSGGDNLDEVWTYFTLRELESPVDPEQLIIARQIASEIERLVSERNLDITMDFAITVSSYLNFKFSNYSGFYKFITINRN